MIVDKYGILVNHESNYKKIAELLKEERSVFISWTDEDSTHFDILFSIPSRIAYLAIPQGGLRYGDLFISIMRKGSFAFEVPNLDTYHTYYAEKLGLSPCDTTKKLADLINGIKKYLIYEQKT